MLRQFSIRDRVYDVITNVMGNHGLAPPRENNDDLFAAGLNSMGMVTLMLAVESEFDVTFPVADLKPDNFRSIQSIEALIQRLQRELPRTNG
jgi:acyl carrier protein